MKVIKSILLSCYKVKSFTNQHKEVSEYHRDNIILDKQPEQYYTMFTDWFVLTFLQINNVKYNKDDWYQNYSNPIFFNELKKAQSKV